MNGLVLNGNILNITKNGGATWGTVPAGGNPVDGFCFFDINTGYISSNGNMYFTSNGGTSWQLKNDKNFYEAPAVFYFINDTTGFCSGSGFTIYKTTDGGGIWEPLPRDNNFTYLEYSFNDLLFFDQNIAWAGGGHGHLELTTNAGGQPLPVSVFAIDPSQLATQNKINLVNHSKSGSQYFWYLNSGLIATTYNASYTSQRASIDTIKLVVKRGGYSDSAVKIIDTRADQRPCNALFQASIDTGSVSVQADYNSLGVLHYWNFGDGFTDSVSAGLTHSYQKIGTYVIRHEVYNIIDGCRSIDSQAVTIVRTQNCVMPDFSYSADSFYTNIFKLKFSYDSTKESGHLFSFINWSFNDGSTASGGTVTYTFSGSGDFPVCLSVKNSFTGCISNICKTVNVRLDSVCNAAMQIRTTSDYYGHNYPARQVHFYAKPLAVKAGKRHTFFITGSNIVINTNNDEHGYYNFFTRTYGNNMDVSGNSCGPNQDEICIDSLYKEVKHVVYDSLIGCSDSSFGYFTVPRAVNVFIKAVPNPLYPQSVGFYAYTINAHGDSIPYSSRWRISNPGFAYYAGDYNGTSASIGYTFSGSGDYKVAVGSSSCISGSREIYYINYHVQADPCPIYPPDFTFSNTQGNTYQYQFQNTTVNANMALGNFNNYMWYFGDGDSSTVANPSHTYMKDGVYEVVLRYTRPDAGCMKEKRKTITVLAPCLVKAGVNFIKDSVNPSVVSFLNSSLPLSDSAKSKWYFGTGDSSTLRDPVYHYLHTGTFTVSLEIKESEFCKSTYDTVINISASDSCNLTSDFSYRIGDKEVTFTNLSKPLPALSSYAWNYGDGKSDTAFSPAHRYDKSGDYLVCLLVTRDQFCSTDTCSLVHFSMVTTGRLSVRPNPVPNTFSIAFYADEADRVAVNIVNSAGSVVKKFSYDVVAGTNIINITGTETWEPGIYFVWISGKKIQLGGSFLKQ